MHSTQHPDLTEWGLASSSVFSSFQMQDGKARHFPGPFCLTILLTYFPLPRLSLGSNPSCSSSLCLFTEKPPWLSIYVMSEFCLAWNILMEHKASSTEFFGTLRSPPLLLSLCVRPEWNGSDCHFLRVTGAWPFRCPPLTRAACLSRIVPSSCQPLLCESKTAHARRSSREALIFCVFCLGCFGLP